MKQFWITFFGSVVGVIIGSVLAVILFFFMIAGLFASALSGADTEPPMPRGGVVLELDLREARLDSPSSSPFNFGGPLSIVEIVQTLQHAEGDDRVQGLLIRANEFGMAPAMAEEIRTAISDFREAGKFVMTHAQGFEGTSVTGYFAIAGSDEIWLQDTASFTASGLAAEIPFYGGMFEQFDANPQFEQFYEYKNAANTFTETTLTDPHREATLSYMNSIFDTAVTSIAADRGMDEAAVRSVFDTAPHTAETASEAGMIDRLGHVVEAREAALNRIDGAGSAMSIEDYAQQMHSWNNRPVIALIEGQGSIVTGTADQGPFGGNEMIGGDAMAEAIEAAANDVSVRAIVIRIDSGGGSAIASDQVWNSVIRAREAGKPVVVSMGSAAASGGYYIAAPADLIFAHNTTITGSIGVLGGKLDLSGTFALIGLNVETLSVGGEFATAFSGQESWTETQREAYRQQMADIYEDFTSRVADGRDLPMERVLEIARGRVWTGAQALDLGLVDEIGGIRDAIDAARDLAGIAPESGVQVRRFPRQLTPYEAFSQLFGVSAENAEAVARLNALMELPEVQAAIEARQAAQGGELQLRSTAPQPR